MAAREQNKQSTRKIGVRLLLVNEPVTKIEIFESVVTHRYRG